MTAQTRPPSNAPDPLGLAKAREMQERRRPAEVILQGSRAPGLQGHRRPPPRLRRCPHACLPRPGRSIRADEILR